MIESVRFKNYKVLRDAVLPLGPVTVIVGPNGSGKTTVLEALRAAATNAIMREWPRSLGSASNEPIEVEIRWGPSTEGISLLKTWQTVAQAPARRDSHRDGSPISPAERNQIDAEIGGFRIFSFERSAIAVQTTLQPNLELASNGGGLAVVLDRMRDLHPERFEALNQELARWLPEFDRILFDTPSNGTRTVRLRVSKGGGSVPSADLSEGTLLCLALLSLSYLPSPPTIIGIEDPDRAIHPRLLRDVQDAIYRLAHPDSALDSRPPVQVIATTHNPYFLSLFRDHPEEVVIAEKRGLEATFRRLSDFAHIDEILQDAPLGDVWYSGVLGGVPARS